MWTSRWKSNNATLWYFGVCLGKESEPKVQEEKKRFNFYGSQRLSEEIYLAPPLSLSTAPRPVAVVDTPKARLQDRRIHTCVPLRRPPLPPPSSSHYHNTTKPKSNPTEDGLVNDNEGSFSPPPKESCITNHLDVCWLFFLVFLVFHIWFSLLVVRFLGRFKTPKFHPSTCIQLAVWTFGREEEGGILHEDLWSRTK